MADIVKGLLLRDHHVLMALRAPSRPRYPGTWSFPGGHVEEGETLEHALQRELSEEIGVQAKSCAFLHRFDDAVTYPDKPATFHVFVVNDWQGDPTNIGEEHTHIRWIKLVDAVQMQNLTFPSYVELLRDCGV